MLIFVEDSFAVKTKVPPSLIGKLTQFSEDNETFEA
jgi:hypothetical protein